MEESYALLTNYFRSHYTPQRLRKLEPWYFAIIYAISATPAVVYLVLDLPPYNKGTIGPAGVSASQLARSTWLTYIAVVLGLGEI